MAALQKISSDALMNLVLWKNLPRELLMLVLARLPVLEIARLHCQLSKEWTMNMEFIRACDQENPNMAALLSYSFAPNEFSVRIFDFNKHVWLYPYCFTLTYQGNAPSGNLFLWKPKASDGGLVCFVSTHKYTKANPLRIVVINPLTQVQYELPPLQNVYTSPPTLVHMKVNSKTKAYKVVVVGSKRQYFKVETYDSVSRQWSRATPSWGRIWGRACEYKSSHCNYFRLKSSRLCAHDLEQGQLELLDCDSLFQFKGASVMQYAFAGDRVFVLYKKLNQPNVASSRFYFITEFQFQNNTTLWVPVKTYNQSLFQEDEKLFDIHACEDVLVIHERFYSANQICCFLNISTGEWHNLLDNSRKDRQVSLMCRVFWNVIP